MRVFLISLGVVLLALLMLAAFGCSGSSGDAGTVKLLLADAPLHLDDGSTVSEVNVTITRVELLANDDEEDGPRATLFTGSESVNLLTLANKPLPELLQLALVSVPAGSYEQLRFIIDEDASNVVVDGVPQPLKVSSGPQTGFKVPLALTVAAGTTQVLLLDFDLTRLHQNNQFLLTPNAVRAVQMSEAGTVTGSVTLGEGVTPTADIPVTLTLRRQGETDPLATTQVVLTTEVLTGTFVINGVPAGTYELTATAPIDEEIVTVNVPAFTVSAGQTADLGAITIALPAPPETEPEP